MIRAGDSWVELSLGQDAEPGDLTEDRYYDDAFASEWHAFWDEPWNPRAWVVRAPFETEAAADWFVTGFEHDGLVWQARRWDATEDEELFGALWPAVAGMFHAQSVIACHRDQLTPEWRTYYDIKLVHCYLNAQGLDVPDERKFHIRSWWGRVMIRTRWAPRLQRRQAARRAKVAA